MEDYQIHITGEPNNFIVVRKSHPNFMAYINYKDRVIELTKLNLLENCSPSTLGKILLEMELYLKGEITHKVMFD